MHAYIYIYIRQLLSLSIHTSSVQKITLDLTDGFSRCFSVDMAPIEVPFKRQGFLGNATRNATMDPSNGRQESNPSAYQALLGACSSVAF